MVLTKNFGLFCKINIYLRPEIYRVEIYDLTFSHYSPVMVLGYICGKKINLSSGWATSRNFDSQVKFAEAVLEAHHIFQDDFTAEELIKLGYE